MSKQDQGSVGLLTTRLVMGDPNAEDTDDGEHPSLMFKARQYLSSTGNPPTQDSQERPSFSVVSYNILAECHRCRADYSYTAEEYLGQAYRHSVLMTELQYLDGDLVCLQEVNPHYFTSCLLPAMNRLGYDGVMHCRTKEYYDEGGATFFKTDSFHLDSSKGVSLSVSANSRVIDKEGMTGSQEVKEAARGYLDRADVVVLTRLRHKPTGQLVSVANVHLWWDDYLHPDVKTVQAACAMQELLEFAGKDAPHILCGDFNSGESSPVYQLISDGRLSESSLHTLQDVQCLVVNDGVSKSLVDHFKAAICHQSPNLKSAYKTVLGKESKVTCYTDEEWQLDYIFYCADTLAVDGVLGMVDAHTLVKTGGLPSKDFSSDHLSLMARFTFL